MPTTPPAATAQTAVWQRLPQGWIEFSSFGESTPAQWWDRYLASGEGWLTDEARATLTAAFEQGVELFGSSEFDFAGMHLEIGEKPAVWFLSTQVLVDAPEAVQDAEQTLAYLAVARLGAQSTSTSFTSRDGRTGVIAFGPVGEPATGIVAVGQLHLPDDGGIAIVTGMTSDPGRYQDLLIRVAFALDTTLVLPVGQTPPDDDPAE